ncbi:hypothetical protein GUK36_35100 [Rhizobium leguminosarum]|jgi:hypothetical protein|uniref:Uncharacterized protein n=1 Tax=Rhizobium leguminosarum TaxID=384 RepID=A0A6P0DRB6_RHILE|nr:hypothetical protein [Rhizobium leguminosarum]NEK54590.1 hypothetical protein [Rhizobium leguminosarum]
MNKALQWFIRLWIAVVILVNVAAIAGMLLHDGFWSGLSRVQGTYSPFNIFNWIMEVLLLSPAMLAAWWLDRRKQNAAL